MFILCTETRVHGDGGGGSPFLKELVWRQIFIERGPSSKPITALEEIAKLLSAFSSKTSAVFHPFHLKGVPNLSVPQLTRLDLKIVNLSAPLFPNT